MSRSLSPAFYRFGRWLTRQTLGRLFTLRVEGLEYLPTTGPAIICPKHQRWEDIPVIGMALPPPLHYIAKVELFQQPLVRELLGAWGGVPVDRKNPRATLSSFRRLLPLLSNRAFIVLFPEGTYFTGRVGPGKRRLIQLLLKLQGQDGLNHLPFVPVGVYYEPWAWGYTAHVRLGPPLTAPSPRQASDLTEALMSSIARLSGF
ncbi:MAG: lysophospholipid acyltransferase family protein [Thermodesulfobacteriota bacterium]